MTMPNFLVIGAPKAGTSALYSYLQQHPQIFMSAVKEPHFFSFENEEIKAKGPGDIERLAGTVTRLEDYQKLFESVSDEIAIGEASTTYLSSDKAAGRIKYHLPQVKLIAILRNPVDAAYASFLHLRRDGDEPINDFALALQQEEERIAKKWEGIWNYKNRGFYYQQVKRYFDIFNREQIRIYRYEDFKSEPAKILQDIFAFLEVDQSFTPDMSEKYNVSAMPKNQALNRLLVKPNPFKSTINLILPQDFRSQIATKIKSWNLSQYQKPQMSPEIRQQLTWGYREDILQLQDLIEQDLSSWLELPEASLKKAS